MTKVNGRPIRAWLPVRSKMWVVGRSKATPMATGAWRGAVGLDPARPVTGPEIAI